MLSSIEYLDIDKMYYCRISFITLLEYSYQHNNNIINNLELPLLFQNNKHMILGNNALIQLNINECNYFDVGNSKFKFFI